VGTLEFRCVTEPIRRIAPNIKYHQAFCTDVDFENDRLTARSALELEEHTAQFTLNYDRLIIASGATSNTFGIPGVSEHAFFLKDISDARNIRHRVLECFEHAMQPETSDTEKRRLLHFAIVGGGPTGVEFAAELHDFVKDDMGRIYPSLCDYVRITVYDVGQRILSSFDEKLGKYAADRFAREGIRVEIGTGVSKVDKKWIVLTTGKTVPVGMIVWATGLAPTTFSKNLACKHDQHTGRLVTDDKLRLFKPGGQVLENVHVLGDCGIIDTMQLPCTAQVAKQQAQYLSRVLNAHAKNLKPTSEADRFVFNPLGTMAYIGGWKAVADVKFPSKGHSEQKVSGRLAWLVWRSAYFSMAVSVKNKILIPMYWFLTWIFGRDISKI
jgi:NADH dehydrogenase FAD-containing subunit